MTKIDLTSYRDDKKDSYFWHELYNKISSNLYAVILTVVILFVFLWSFIFAKIEGLSYFDGIYWIFTTMTTVGYGDISPKLIMGKLVAMTTMLAGISVLGYLMSRTMDMVVDANLKGVFGLKKAKTKKHVIVCGWNKVSETAVRQLSEEHENIIVIDSELHPELKQIPGVHFIVGDPKSPETLTKANLDETKFVIVAMEDDSDVLLSTHIIRELNPTVEIVARIDQHRHVKIAQKAGATHIVSPASIGGNLLVEAATNPSVVKWVMEATAYEQEGIELMEYDVTASSWSNGKTVGKLRDKLGHKAILLSVNSDKGHDTLPEDGYKIKTGDSLILVINPAKYKTIDL